MKKRLTVLLLVMVMVLSLFTPALAVDDGEQYLQQSDLAAISAQVEGDEAVAMAVEEASDSATGVTQQEAARFLLFYAGMKESQLGTYPDDYNAMAESVGLTKNIEWTPAELCTVEEFNTMLQNVQELYKAMHKDVKEPLFVDGLAQPIFEYSDPTQANGDTGVVRFCVYVETNYDTDGDGKLDLVKALVQLPQEALKGQKFSTIYEARPYITGCTDRGIAYVDEEFTGDLHATAPARTPAGTYTTAAAVQDANPDDWYYWNEYEDMYDYEDLTWYDYYLVRGFAVVECGGLGTKGSEGFETCGSDVEIDAFKCVIEWLHGDRVAYTDKTSNLAIKADWSTGKVGMTGRSYAGTTQFGLATTGVAGLETIVPVAGIASWYEYTNSQGVSTRGSAAYTNTLAAYCAGRYLDKEDFATIADSYGRYLNQMKEEQEATNGDYGPHWENRDYTKDWANIKCPALIVHGLNDTNVRTKEFDLMYQAYQKAGVDVKLLLHQGTHLTPTYPSQEYEMYTDGELYDTVLNRWFSHYLYGEDNGADQMAAVTVQSNVDGSWTHYSDWKTDNSVTLSCGDVAETETSVVAGNITEIDNSGSRPVTKVVEQGKVATYTFEVPEDITVQGAIAVKFTATPTSDKIDELDAIRLTADLKDTSEEDFMAYVPSRSYLPLTTLKENGAWMGGGVSNFDLVEYVQTATSSKSIGQGYIDLYNPTAGYDSYTAAERTALKNGESYEYTVYLQPSVYTVKAGHTLELSLSLVSFDVNAPKISIEVDNAASSVIIPVHTEPTVDPTPVNPFTDVKEGTFYYDAVLALAAQGVIAGETATTFAPSSDVTRAQVVAFLYRMAGSPESSATVPFTDVRENAYYTSALAWAVENEIAAGVSDTEFDPDSAVTREQFVSFLYRYAALEGKANGEPADLSAYTDASSVSRYAQAAMAWAVGQKIVAGVETDVLGPQATATRAQAAAILYRYENI